MKNTATIANTNQPAPGPEVVHETEVQRQHIRIQLPATAEIGEQTFKIADMSAGGFSIQTKHKYEFSEKGVDVKIHFPFESFAFHFKAKAAVVYRNKGKGVTGFRFQETGRRQASLLNHIIKSYLAGLLTTEKDLIAIAARDSFMLPREIAGNDNVPRTRLSRIAPMAAISVAFMLGVFVLFGNIYESTAMVKSDMGRVEGNTYAARAGANGAFYSLLAEGAERVDMNQPIAIVKNPRADGDGTELPADGGVMVKSPCDCLVVGRHARDGEFVAAGQTLYDLQPVNDDMWVTATLPPRQAQRLRLQDDARIRVAGETDFMNGNVAAFLSPDLDKDVARIKVRTDKPIPYYLAGRLAYVEFRLH